MAKGLAQKMFPTGFYVDSAGIDAETTGGANFRAISAMGEYGVDLMNHLCQEHHRCCHLGVRPCGSNG